MIWWDWTRPQQFSLLAALALIAASPGALAMIVGAWTFDWQVLLGSCVTLYPLPLLGTMLTGRMPTHIPYGPVDRATDPVQFWMSVGIHAVVLALYIGVVALFINDLIYL